MTREEFESLQSELQQSGKPLMSFLEEKGVKYGTYRYWRGKTMPEDDRCDGLAPISITQKDGQQWSPSADVLPRGVTLLFPNGLRAHIGLGAEEILARLFDRSLESHVLPQ